MADEPNFQDMREADGHRRALPRIDGCHDVTAYVVRISELMAEVEDLRAERDAGKWSREMRAELTADAVRHASSVTAELARLRAWLQWLSASSHLAVMALRGDPAPGETP